MTETPTKYHRLTPDEVDNIKLRLHDTFGIDLAKEYQVSDKTIQKIKKKYGIKAKRKERLKYHTHAELYDKQRDHKQATCMTHDTEILFQTLKFSIRCPDCGKIIASENNCKDFLQKLLDHQGSKKNIIEQTI